MMKILRRIVVGVVLVVVIAYAGVLGWLYVDQRAMQYDPKSEAVTLAEAGLSGADAVTIPTSGGETVAGWYQAPAVGMPAILYLKGNAGTFSEEHVRFAQFVADGYGFLAFDYRGFPASPGTLNETNVLADATAAFDWLAAKGAPVLIWGRSLGTGPATYTASVRDAEALYLETPFLSAVTVAAERYWFIPVGWVMADQFHSDQWIADVTEPVFVAHGTGDRTIDVSNGERLYALAKNPQGIWIEPGAGHSDLWKAGEWARAKAFFEAVAAE